MASALFTMQMYLNPISCNLYESDNMEGRSRQHEANNRFLMSAALSGQFQRSQIYPQEIKMQQNKIKKKLLLNCCLNLHPYYQAKNND